MELKQEALTTKEDGHDLPERDISAVTIKETGERTSKIETDSSSKVQELFNRLSYGEGDRAQQIIESLHIPPEVIQSAKVQEMATDFLSRVLSAGSPFVAQKIIESFHIPLEVAQEAAKAAIPHYLKYDEFDTALTVIESLDMSPESIQSPEVQKAAQEGFVRSLFQSNKEETQKIMGLLHIKIDIEDIQASVLEESKLVLQEIFKERLPDLYNNLDFLCEIIPLSQENLQRILALTKQHPHLREALEQNPTNGFKLVLEYPNFNERSKAHVDTLFALSDQAAAQDLGRDTPASRRFINGGLRDYDQNPRTWENLNDTGIDLDAWLNYEAMESIILVSSEVPPSQILENPTVRLEASMTAYIKLLKHALQHCKAELLKYMIEADTSPDTNEMVINMRATIARFNEEGDGEKAEALQEKLNAHLVKLRTHQKNISLYEKVLSDFAIIQRQVRQQNANVTLLKQSESNIRNVVMHTKEDSLRLKTLPEEIRAHTLKSSLLFEEMRKTLATTLAPALGEHGQLRAESVLQEIDEQFAESDSHMATDMHDLSSYTKENKGDKEYEPVTIQVCNRDPNKDLYIGNDCPCCVAINNKIWGEDSPIAEYLTDPAVNIVKVVNSKGKAVVALWTYVAQVEGEPVLVIDNIEGNTDYTSYYKDQLWNLSKNYMMQYAARIGARAVYLGIAHNDLDGEMQDGQIEEGILDKVGPQNSVDGYVLEANDHGAWLVGRVESGNVGSSPDARSEKEFAMQEQ